jgi:ABC-2 type transport system permease protein
MSYAAITRERDSGSIKVLLSLPLSRRDIVFGKFLGRSVAVAIPVLVALIVAALLLIGVGGLNATSYLVFAASTLLLVVAVAGLGVGLSARIDTTRRAILASIAAFALFLVFWNPLTSVGVAILQGVLSLGGVELSNQVGFTLENGTKLLNPFEAYKDLLAPHTVRPSVAQQYARSFDAAPIYLKAPTSILVLIGWAIAPVWLGIRHFERIDL